MARLLKCWHYLLMLLVLSGCSVNTPPHTSLSLVRFESPELSAKPLSVQLNQGLSEDRIFTLSNNQESQVSYGCSQSDWTTVDGSCEQDYAFLRGSLAIATGLEVAYTKHSDHRISVKHQFAGQHRENAAAGNWSQAVVVGYSWQQNDYDRETFEQRYSSSPDIYLTHSRWQQKTTGYDIGYVLGYRVSPRLLIYGGPYLYKGKLKGEQILTLMQDNSETESIIELDSTGRKLGLNLALQFNFGKYFVLQTEVVSSRLTWADVNKQASQINIMAGVQF